MRGISLIFCLLMLAGSTHISAQQAQEGRPMLQIRSLRQNDFTFFSNLNLSYQYQKGKYGFDLQFHHDNIYNTSLDQDRFVQLYFKSFLRQHYDLSKEISLVSELENDHYVNSDNEKVSLYGGVRYKPWSYLEVTPLVGASIDRRNGVVDVGFSPALRVRAHHEWANKLTYDAGAYARAKFINPRQQRNVTAFQFGSKEFAENTRIAFGIKAGSHELDDYQGNRDSLGLFQPQIVKRIISDSISPILRLDYQFGPGFVWQSENEMLLFRRSFKYNSLTNELPGENDLSFQGMELLSRQRLSVRREKFTFTGYYEFQFVDRGYDLRNTTDQNEVEFVQNEEREKQKDFQKRQHKTDLRIMQRIGDRHVLDASITNIYLQYDTPTEENYDDRDELSYIGSLAWNTRWQSNFSTSLALSGNYRHYAFLYGEKSQDNYKQRSLRMDFGYNWNITKRLAVQGKNSVYVTYNVKDFTDFNRTDRSTRNLETNFKANYRPIRNLENNLTIYRKETHQSYLNWEAFSETTLDTIGIITIEQTNRYTFPIKGKGIRLFADMGYKHFNQTKRFKTIMIDDANELVPIVLHQINTQSGPLMGFGFRDKHQSSIEATLWLQFQNRRNRWFRQSELSALGITYDIDDLRKVEKEVKPYFTLNFNYFFN